VSEETRRQAVALAAAAIHVATCRAAETGAACDGGTRTDFDLAERGVFAALPVIRAAERERIAALAEAEAARGAKTGLDRIALRAFAARLREETT
jgi:hypothetical protein